jgi:protoporphyrinogen oxidase
MDVIRKLGPIELTRCLLSYLWAAIKPKGREDTFEEWVSNRFGKRLYGHFFKTYSEKVWGVPGSEIRSEWAAQRIKNLSFFSAAKSAFFGNKGNKITSLIDEFNYPRYGPGQMWEQMTDDIREHGGEVRLNAPVTRLRLEGDRVVEVVAGGETLTPSYVISSLPLRTTVGITDPDAAAEVRDAARGLRYRDFLTVSLVIDGEDLFPDNWIYIHEPGVKVGRIQNFRSWSPWMVPNETDASVGLEYFCFEGDELWNMADDDLVALATRELQELGLAQAEKVKFGFVVRVHKAYPMYDAEYGERVDTIRGWLDSVENLVQVGRNGLHRYNNSDHSMLTAMRAVDNILLGTDHDIWAVNAESVYHEEHVEPEQPYRDAPETPSMDEPLASEKR